MPSPRQPSLLVTGALVLALAASAPAAEQPISGKKLALRRTPSRSSLTFLSKDPAFLLPAPGGPDDPRTAGLTIELSSVVDSATLAIPPGSAGWTVRIGTITKYKFHDRLQAVKMALLQQGRTLRITTRDAGLALSAPQGGVLVQIHTGSLSNCVSFDTPSVDVPGRFVARNAPPPPACPTPTTTTTTTMPPVCSGEGGTCTLGGGCCPGLECALLGGPGGGAIGECVGSCASREGAVCGSSLPGANPIDCCPEQYCVVEFGPGGIPAAGFCQTTPPTTQCCEFSGAGGCADIQENACVGGFSPAATGTVCDGTSGTCAAARTGDSGCCDIPNAFPWQRCFEGPNAATACSSVSGTFHAGYRCAGGCVAP